MASITAAKTPARVSRKSGKKKERAQGRSAVTKERIAAERNALLADRQTQLESILDTHDTLVSWTVWNSTPISGNH